MGASLLSFTYCGSAHCSTHEALLISSFDFYFILFLFFCFTRFPLLKVERMRDDVCNQEIRQKTLIQEDRWLCLFRLFVSTFAALKEWDLGL
jgi:hypothetical protein